MGKSKKTEDNTKVEARPVGQGKDPLAEGNTLVNPTNSEAETHYEVKERSDDVREAANKIADQDANERAEEHNAQAPAPAAEVPNSTEAEQEEIAEGRAEEGEEPVPAEEATPEEVPAEEETPAEEASEPEVPAEEPASDEPTEADLEV